MSVNLLAIFIKQNLGWYRNYPVISHELLVLILQNIKEYHIYFARIFLPHLIQYKFHFFAGNTVFCTKLKESDLVHLVVLLVIIY